jgi:hypothetical protein
MNDGSTSSPFKEVGLNPENKKIKNEEKMRV